MLQEPLVGQHESSATEAEGVLEGARRVNIFRNLALLAVKMVVIIGVWVGLWFVWLKNDVNQWIDSCRLTSASNNDSVMVCLISSSDWRLLGAPMASAGILVLLALIIPSCWKQCESKMEALWCGSSSRLLACITCIIIAIGCGIMALWAPPQHWKDGVDARVLALVLGGLVLAVCLSYYGFSCCGLSITYGSIYLNMLHLVCLMTLYFEQSLNGYPRPRVFGTDMALPYTLWMSGGMFVVLVLFYCMEDSYVCLLIGITSDVGLLFLKGINIMWEIAYSSNVYRLIPFVNILSCCFLLFDISWLSSLLVSTRIRKNRGELYEAEQDQASFFSIYTFWWVYRTLQSANTTGKLDECDLPKLPEMDRVRTLLEKFSNIWREYEQKDIGGWGLLYALAYKIQKPVFMSALLHGWLFLLLMLLDPIILRVLLDDNSTGKASVDTMIQSLFLVLVLASSMFVRVTCMEICYFHATRVNNNVRSVLVSAIYKKSLLGGESDEYTTGKLTNLMATDADKLGKTSWMLFFLAQWTWAVASLPVVIICMHQVVGNAVWIGLGSIFIGGYVGRLVSSFEKPAVRRLQEKRDVRSQLVKEMLSSITVIKLQVWEEEWRERVCEARDLELRELFTMRVLYALNIFIFTLLNVFIPISIFGWYTWVEGNSLDSKTAFLTLAWIAQMSWSVNCLPAIYNMYASLSPSCERLAAFFNSGDKVSWLDGFGEDSTKPLNVDTGFAVDLFGPAKLGYKHSRRDEGDNDEDPLEAECDQIPKDDHERVVLKNVSLQIKKGEFIVIAGPVGSGKSTLLGSLSKGLEPLEGACNVAGSRAFVSQRPFLLNGTIKENILFGLPYDEGNYQDVIHYAALTQDLAAMQDGDDTVVGESGVQLSGGQKARVAFARALYSNADCYFFDDVLSAVDANTGQFLWDRVITSRLAGKTIVLATHQVQYISRNEVDRVVILSPNGDIMVGAWKDIHEQVNSDITKYVGTDKRNENDESETSANEVLTRMTSIVKDQNDDMLSPSKLVLLQECEDRIKQLLHGYSGCTIDLQLVDDLCAALRGETASEEKKREGLIHWQDLKVYLSLFGTRLTLFILGIVVVVETISGVLMNVWLYIWGDAGSSDPKYLYIYSAIGGCSAILGATVSFTLTLCALQASKKIHVVMFERLLGAAMSFFDRTPSGQIQNRFLQDLANIDNYVPNTVLDQITKTLDMVTQVGLVLIFAPWVICTWPFVFLPFFWVFSTVRCAARDTRRLEAIAHSPVYTQFSDVLKGRQCIRAYAAEKRFEGWNALLVSAMARGKYANEAVCKWAQTLTTQNGCLLYLSCGIICIFLTHNGSMTLGQFGLVLLYAASLQRSSMDYMMGLTVLEAQFVSVERVAEFTRIPNEFESDPGSQFSSDLVIIQNRDKERICDWPTTGDLKLVNVRMRYALYKPSVLNGLSFHAAGGSKVALCGRTGCGKSSSFGAITRLYPISSGRIEVDGVDLQSLPLKTVRNAIRVITQDSILVMGTLRENLLVGNEEITEGEMWAALDQAQMKAFVSSLPGGLDCSIDDGGKNFSVGQRQLLCVARALLPKAGILPKLLLCDEATANIDLETDKQVHDVLLGLDATVVMICHRLQHIHRFDSVVIVSPEGTLLEQGPPADLVRVPNSALNELISKAGLN